MGKALGDVGDFIADLGTAAATALFGLVGFTIASTQQDLDAETRATEFSYKVDAGLPIPFGRVPYAGDVNYRVAYDATNRYQSIFATLAASGPIKSIVSFAADDELTSFDVTYGKATNGLHQDNMWLQTKLGTQPQDALTSPTGPGAGIAAPDWGTDHKQSGRAVYCLTMFENSKFSEYPGGIVRPLFVLEGVYGWDPRLDSTWPGGSGTCDIEDPSTWVWIDNPGIAALNWIIGRWEGLSASYSPDRYGVPYDCSIVAGLGASLEGVDVEAYINAANVADANGWTVAGVPTSTEDKYEVLTKLLQAGGAEPARIAGKISCIVHTEEVASALTVTAADTAGPVEVAFARSRLDRRNTGIPRIWSEDHNWERTPLAPVTDSAWVTEDGGERSRGIDLHYVSDADQGAQLAYYALANAREPISGVVPFKPHMRRIAPGDCFTWSVPGYPLDGVKVKCLKRTYDPMTGEVKITFRQETDAKHAAALALTGTTPAEVTPPTPPSDVVDDPTDFTATVDEDAVTLEWTVGSANYFRTLIYVSDSNDFATATEIASKGYVSGATQTYIHRPGPGTWYYWVQGRSYDFNLSAEVGPETAVVVDGTAAALTAITDGTTPFTGLNIGGTDVKPFLDKTDGSKLVMASGLDTAVVETAAIAVEAVTDHDFDFTAAVVDCKNESTAGVVVATKSVTLAAGEAAKLEGNCSVSVDATSAGLAVAYLAIYRDGVVIPETLRISATALPSTGLAASATTIFTDEPGAGTFTYTLRGYVGEADNFDSYDISYRYLGVTRVKR